MLHTTSNLHTPQTLISYPSLYLLVVKSVSKLLDPLFSARPQLHASSVRFPHAHAEESVGSLFSVAALSQAIQTSVYIREVGGGWVVGGRWWILGIRTGERGHKVKERRERHTALKSRLLSTRALCLLSAHAGAVVTSAADHLGCWSWLVGW